MKYLPFLLSGAVILTMGCFSLTWFKSDQNEIHQVSIGLLRELEKITGSQLCSETGLSSISEIRGLASMRVPPYGGGIRHGNDRPAHIERRITLLHDFPDNKHPCVNMGSWPSNIFQPEERFFVKTSGFIDLGESKIPVIVTRHATSQFSHANFSGAIIIRISGGPGGIPINPASDYIINLREDSLIVDVLHSGSGVNLIYPSANFGIASKQIGDFIQGVRHLNPKAQIVLVGESLGGILALASTDFERKSPKSAPTVDKLILLSPLAMSPNEFIAQSDRKARAEPASSLLYPYRTLRTHSDDWRSREIRMLNSIDVLRRYFEPKFRDTDIQDRLRPLEGLDVLLLYGSNDPIVGVDVLDRLGSSKNLRSIRIEGMGHYPSDVPHFSQMRNAIEEFVD